MLRRRSCRWLEPVQHPELAAALVLSACGSSRAIDAPSPPETGLDLALLGDTDVRRVYGSTGDGSLGLPVAGGSDVDGDGLLDTAFAAFGTDTGDTLCYSAATGDLDGDGRADLIVNGMVGNGSSPDAVDTGNLLILGPPISSR
jgi:FG-GAP repeat